MSESNTRLVLVAYPPEFADYGLFSERCGKLLASLKPYAVVALDDSRGFCRTYFEAALERVEPSACPLSEQERLLRECSHALVFWNGQQFSSYVHLSMLLGRMMRVVPIKTTRVVNVDRGDECDVYIGRRGPWGNPFVLGKDGDRDEVVEKYRRYFVNKIGADPAFKASIDSLAGARLGCHCKPYVCHGDVIAEYLNTALANGTQRNTDKPAQGEKSGADEA